MLFFADDAIDAASAATPAAQYGTMSIAQSALRRALLLILLLLMLMMRCFHAIEDGR